MFKKGDVLNARDTGGVVKSCAAENEYCNCDEDICNNLSNNLTNGNPPVVDVFPIGKGGFPASYVRFTGVELIVETLYV